MRTASKTVLILALLLPLLTAVPGCKTTEASTKAKPGEKSRGSGYPDSLYLKAIGTGESQFEAKDRALEELSRIFEAKVMSDTLDRVRSVVKISGGKTTEDTEQRIESRLNVISQVDLKGVEIAETWKEGSTHNALAVLDRAKARDTWLGEIAGLDEKIASKLEASSSLSGRLMRYRALKEAMSLWLEREVLVSRLSVLGYREGGPTAYDPKAILTGIPRLKAAMPIYLDISGGYAQDARETVSKALGDAGFVMTSDRNDAPVIISGTVNVEPVDIPHPEWKYARGRVALEVRDVEAGLTVGEVKTDKRASHLSMDEAAQKAVKKVLPQASRELVEFLEEPPGSEE
jgi:hypothetical protein